MLIFSLFLPSCSKGSDKSLGKSFDKLTKEATDLASPELSKLVIKCGNYWYTKNLIADYYQYKRLKGGQIVPGKSGLSEADKLNGVEWRGLICYEFDKVSQERNTGWTKWSEWKTDVNSVCMFLERKNGKWDMQKAKGMFQPDYYALTCNEIEKLQ